MAQSSGHGASDALAHEHNALPQDKLYELEQYKKIIQLRDAVLAGNHAAIRNPIELLSSTQAQSAVADTLEGRIPHDAEASLGPSGHASKRRAPDLNPIFLEKSDHLIRAELKLQRQRSERTLREEVEQRRPTKNAAPETPTELDISDVLSKALTLVPAIAAPPPELPAAAANTDDRSDSFDNNTFYSSQHDTPDLRSTPSRREMQDPKIGSGAGPKSSDEVIDDLYAPPSPQTRPILPSSTHQHGPQLATEIPAAASLPRSLAVVPGLNNYPATGGSSAWPGTQQSNIHSEAHAVAVQETESSGRGNLGRSPLPRATEAYAEAHPPSPLLRTHDLQPIAPQPAHYATLPIDSSASNSGVPTAVGTPAQVAALRHDPTSITSPESSPQGGRPPERKRSKKKKRKAERQAAEADAVYIKPEPRSPSPMAAPSYVRPNKRAKHAQRQAQGPGPSYPPTPGLAPSYDPSDYDTTASAGRTDGAPSATVQGETVYTPHARGAPHHPRSVSTTLHGGRRYSGGYVDSRGRVAHQPGYGAYQTQPYVVQEPPEVMYDYVDSTDGYPRAVSHQIPYEASRMSLRPETTPYTGIARPQPQRIFVDSTGREYLEPRRPMVRQSVAPPGYYREPEVIYERAPPRAVSRYAEPPHYVDGGPSYGQVTPAYSAPRRVVTQPEYATRHYGEGHASEYPRRSMMPPDVRMADPPVQEYAPRPASVRLPQPGEYASPQDYGSGPESRPETVAGGYGQGAPTQGRQTPGQGYAWGYEPVAPPAGRPAAAPGYYAPPGRAADDIAFIEEPRGATQEIVYTDSGREEVYR